MVSKAKNEQVCKRLKGYRGCNSYISRNEKEKSLILYADCDISNSLHGLSPLLSTKFFRKMTAYASV